ncbi:type VI secretion system lipoprotein TssJ [Deferribacter abyssi]|uniref:type VI secretion system lipoprotein TssJ n=1 Tax=Deferribacter abyssi TaxID=213806 RepID=UPI003C234523
MFKFKLKTLVVFINFFLFFMACSKKMNPVPTWSFEKKAITINYKSDLLLNAFGGNPHTLMIVVYQMSKPDSFNQFIQYPAGIRKLLNQNISSPDILSHKRFFIEPNSSGKLLLDRAEGAKWLGIVAGYYALEPDKSARIFKIPYKIEEKGFIRKKKIAVIPKVRITVFFTKNSIQVEKISGRD